MVAEVRPPAKEHKPLLETSAQCPLLANGCEADGHDGEDADEHLIPVGNRIHDLVIALEHYLSPEQIAACRRAYLVSAQAHRGQRRKSGEAYISHPLAVAQILAGMRADSMCICAALLHDVIEDTTLSKADLAEQFGDKVAELVDGVSKLGSAHAGSRAEKYAASLQKLLIAVTQDIRVIIIKLADRLHNMRTLQAMRRESRQRIARETLEIYTPIANRLGLNAISAEYQELAFASLHPWRARILREALEAVTSTRSRLVGTIETTLREALEQAGIDSELNARHKKAFAVYRRMKDKARGFTDLADVFAFQVIVDRVDTCYRVLGLLHNLYKPIPGRFKDYIAIPKRNGYQSLHTVLVGPKGLQIEIQIRTENMEQVANLGIAAHWYYKGGCPDCSDSAHLAEGWLKNLIEMQGNTADSQDFVEHVKFDFSTREVWVFTPMGRIVSLKRGATAVDFAYAIHSDIGHHCCAARINRRMAPLNSVLRNGQTVEIITAPSANPSPNWLNFVVTSRARVAIRSYLKNLRNYQAHEFGYRLLSNELARLGLTLDDVDPKRLSDYLDEVQLADRDDLYCKIGLGERSAMMVIARLFGARTEPEAGVAHQKLAISGSEGVVVNYAGCCRPIPGDSIMATFTPGRGAVVHRSVCRNLTGLAERQESLEDVKWADDPQGQFTSEIVIEVSDRCGALAAITTAIAEKQASIRNVHMARKDNALIKLDFVIQVTGREHLAHIIRRVRSIPSVTRIGRVLRA